MDYELRSSEVREILAISNSTFWRLRITDPTFPKPKNLGKRLYRYSRQEIVEWLEKRKQNDHQ